MSFVACSSCAEAVRQLETERDQLKSELFETRNLLELVQADLARHRAEYERIQPNTPERVPKPELQLAFDRVIETLSEEPAARLLKAVNTETSPKSDPAPKKKKPRPHGRRRLDLLNLPVEQIVIDPEEVIAANGAGFEQVGEETSQRIAFKPASFVRLAITRRKFARTGTSAVALSPMTIAPIPDSVWPGVMADPSAIAQIIIGKYDDILPLHRQERISARLGFDLPRSTQCEWLGAAHAVVHRVVAAMKKEALSSAYCIAMDATGAPVRSTRKCARWHIWTLIADRDHVLFDYSEKHESRAVTTMLAGFRGHLLVDAAPIYDALYTSGDIVEVGCWYHQRRYFWRALGSEKTLALEALSLIAQLFKVERETRSLAFAERTGRRAELATPILELLDAWISSHRDKVDPRGPLDKAIGYYDNQRTALHRFLADGRLRLDNSISEQQLRNVALGRHNWTFFENETGLRWYTVFRSLIASCALHGLNAQTYLEQLLRLAPHWAANRVIELAPKYWAWTVSKLDDRQRSIIVRPWERSWPTVALPDRRAAAA